MYPVLYLQRSVYGLFGLGPAGTGTTNSCQSVIQQHNSRRIGLLAFKLQFWPVGGFFVVVVCLMEREELHHLGIEKCCLRFTPT